MKPISKILILNLFFISFFSNNAFSFFCSEGESGLFGIEFENANGEAIDLPQIKNEGKVKGTFISVTRSVLKEKGIKVDFLDDKHQFEAITYVQQTTPVQEGKVYITTQNDDIYIVINPNKINTAVTGGIWGVHNSGKEVGVYSVEEAFYKVQSLETGAESKVELKDFNNGIQCQVSLPQLEAVGPGN